MIRSRQPFSIGVIVSSTIHGILLHVVFGTKYRRPLIAAGWRDSLYAYMNVTAKAHEATIVRAGGVNDHVHLLLRVHPAFAIADTLRDVKSASSKWVNATSRCSEKFRWQRGYAAFSVSASVAPTVQRYIENQEDHHRRLTFREEYCALLWKHGVQFDPEQLFDDEYIA